jgi:hypothetical protein
MHSATPRHPLLLIGVAYVIAASASKLMAVRLWRDSVGYEEAEECSEKEHRKSSRSSKEKTDYCTLAEFRADGPGQEGRSGGETQAAGKVRLTISSVTVENAANPPAAG